MKNPLYYFVCSVSLAASLPRGTAANSQKPAPSEPGKELRVLAESDREAFRADGRGEHRVFLGRAGQGEKESVTFLGVETSPVTPTLTAQLGLADGSGLVVSHVASDGPAANALKEHDILLKLDDQILVEQRQFAVLIRNHKEGDEVTLTYMRTGKQATAKVKLGKHEVPKMGLMFDQPVPGVNSFFSIGPGAKFERVFPGPDAPEGREETDRMLALIQRGPGAPDGGGARAITPGARFKIERQGTPGMRAMSINTRNSNIVFSDDAGSLDLTIKDGAKTLVAKNGQGEQVFSGLVTTPEERKALPAGLRERLEKLERMQDVNFRTDSDFKGSETKVMRPLGREISLPQRASPPPRAALFY